MTMTASEIIFNPTPKGCAAMFPASTDIPGSSASGAGELAFRAAEKRCTGTTGGTGDSKAETALKLMLMTGKPLSGKTLGIIGFGRTGRETARSAHRGFGMKIVVHNQSIVSDDDLDQISASQVDDIDHLLGQSDFVSLHCLADAQNRHLIDALRLNAMKPDAYLINTSGSGLVDEEALADALWYDTIAGAGLDVTPAETHLCDRLLGCENVTLPHAEVTPAQPSRLAM
ncbi:MAG: NAD(P)-dependent oxidoreductase [Pseudomonadota bacterium]